MSATGFGPVALAAAIAPTSTLGAVPLTSVWTAERAEQWWAMHRPRPQDARPVADVLLSHEGRELRIGRSRGLRASDGSK